MRRRAFLKAGGSAALGVAMGGCAGGLRATTAPGIAPRRRVRALVPVDVSMDRIIRTTVGLRPHRDSGFLLKAERFDDKTVIHNFGHGGAGMSLSWGTGLLTAELALAHTERRAAVIGCGIIGLTTARQLQRRGFDVTIYAMTLPPDTTSNMSWAGFTPLSGLVSNNRRTPEWDAQFNRAAEIAYREHQNLAGREYGVSWINEYVLRRNPSTAAPPAGPITSAPRERVESLEAGQVVLGPGEHPFATDHVIERPLLRFEPAIYLDALMRDVVAFGGRIVVRAFDTPRDLMTLTESLIVNCTGLGAKKLFGDEELVPVRGQLVVLPPQAEVTYAFGGMLPRRDGIVLGHTNLRGSWSLDVDPVAQRQVIERAMATFAAMREPMGARAAARAEAPIVPPPSASAYFGLES